MLWVLLGSTFLYAAAVSSTKLPILFSYDRIFQGKAKLPFQVCLGLGGFLV